MAITTGAHLSHYQIRSPLGAGGMGEVYRALDTRLDREVALKLLPVEFTQDEERVRRFRQEAKAASALNHPNIITIYEIGQEQGKHYLATEFIDGQTLRRQLQSGPLKMAAALEIATQIAAALAAAHEAGIIHRDIKPENVMVRPDGIVKVLDFGLAKLTEKPAHTDLNAEAATLAKLTTEAGTVMGTPQYMSPEQARGLRVDKRTDLFSFGIVLFEMLTERPPFAGETISHLIVAILEKEPPPLAQFLADVPAELEHILKQTLAKRADERYASAKDLLLDLKKLQRRLEYEAEFSPPTTADQPDAAATQKLQQAPTVPTGARQAIAANAAQDEYKTMVPAAIVAPTQTNPTSVLPAAVTPSLAPKRKAKPQWWWFGLLGLLLLAGGLFVYRSWATQSKQIASIAVLPFENASGNADVEYLSDGMTETLISSLSQLPNLHVKARSSVFRYKGQASDAPTIGRELNVQAILNGRVVQHSEDLILYLELVDAPTGNRIWGDQYNKKLTNLVALQTEIARDVSQKLQTKLSGADEQRLAKNHTENAQAYQLYLRGRFYWNKRTTNDTQRAVEYFHQAIAIDPNYARGYAGLADAYALVSFYDSALPFETMPKAKAAALKALALDGNLAEAHASLGFILTTFDYDFAGAEAQYKRAIELDPNYASAHQWYGEMLSYLGQHEAASAELRRALELDPFSLVINRTYGSILFVARKYDESIAQSKKTLELDGNYAAAHLGLAMAYQLQGNHAGCVEEFAKYQELVGDRPAAELMRASLARGGWIGFLRMMTGARRPENLLLYNPAMLLAALGEKDAAFAALNKAYENREFILVWLKFDPRLDPLRDDSRFQALLQRVGLPTQ